MFLLVSSQLEKHSSRELHKLKIKSTFNSKTLLKNFMKMSSFCLSTCLYIPTKSSKPEYFQEVQKGEIGLKRVNFVLLTF